jgi:tol-pal system protein YbgF
MPSSCTRPSSRRRRASALGLWGAVLGAALAGCATGRAPASNQAELAASVEKLRAENAAYARKVEELENQVFILNDEASARRAGEPPAPVAALAPPALPEVKLAPGEGTPQPEASSAPESLVDETVVEYSGAAAERRQKRPLLRLWGPAEGEPPSSSESEVERDAGGAAEARTARPRRRPPSPADAPPRASGATPTGSRDDQAGMSAYRQALALVQARRHDEAVAALRGFVKDFANHDYADNAQYWLGECFYDRQDYSAALREFRKVPEKFPHGNKVPDALLKTAFSYLALGSRRPGRETLQQIVRQHPAHPAAGLAAAKLAELDRETTVTVAPLSKEKVR